MSDQRVLATPAALQAARQMRATVNQLHAQARQIVAQGQVLMRPADWDGLEATRFRQETWPGLTRNLTRLMQHLDQVDAHAEKVIQDIMRAGTEGRVTPARPAPPARTPETHHSGVMGWVHAGLAVASFIPVVGTAASLVDAGLYVAEGDYVGAALSAAGAIPLVGEGANALKAGRLAVQGARALEETAQVVRVGGEGVRALEAAGEGARAIKAGDKALQGELALDRAAATGRAMPTELNPEQIQQVTREFQEIGGDQTMLRINEGRRTGYVDERNVINVRGDVFPNPEGQGANATMSSRAALAHELGHARHNAPETHPDWLPPGNIDDEARASIWAAKNVPGLSIEERVSLINDAKQRGGVIPETYDSFIQDAMTEYWSKAFGGSGGG